MNYFIFDYTTHSHLIDSFLESAFQAHNHPRVKTKDWFKWKFKDNPFGETILACAEDNGQIVGCVAYGVQPFQLFNKKIKGVISFETFVHPNFQGQGIFNNLVQLAEKQLISQGVDFMLNFPNSNSLRGFLKNNWKELECPEYWIKGNKLFTIPFSLKEIRLGFIPNSSNLEVLNSPLKFNQYSNDVLTSVISGEYLEWRFFTFPITEYIIIESENYYSIVRMGKRGKIREGQVLFVNIKNREKFKLSSFLESCKKQTNYDILSFPISKNNPIRNMLKKNLFIKVPNRTNICYKILNPNVVTDKDVESISLSAVNYHTY